MSVVRKILSQNDRIDLMRHDAPFVPSHAQMAPIFRADAPFAHTGQVDALFKKIESEVSQPRAVPCPSLVPKPNVRTHY